MALRWQHRLLERVAAVAAGGPLRAAIVTAWVVLGATTLARHELQPQETFFEEVHQVTADLEAWRGKTLLVWGRVVEGSIERANTAGSYRFQVESLAPRPGAVLRAIYTGALPDRFRSRAQVMLL